MEVNESGEYSHYYHKCDEIRDICTTLFQGKKWSLEFKRIKTKQEHVDLFSRLIDEYGENEPIFYQTNFNHPFIDFNMDVVNEGIDLFRNDHTKFKCICMSHFPESIRMSVDGPDRKRIGSYVTRSGYKSIDTMSIFNLRWVYYIISRLQWPADNFKSDKYRFFITAQGRKWLGRDGLLKSVADADFKVFSPLRELCRHIDSYSSCLSSIPKLVIPEEDNVYDNSADAITKKMTSMMQPIQIYIYPPSNPNLLPADWLETGIRLAAQDPRMHKEI